jgi:hypothetical protein
MLWAQKDAHGNKRYNVPPPDWMWVLDYAEQRRCLPWEIDDSEPPMLWIIRQMRVDAIKRELNG